MIFPGSRYATVTTTTANVNGVPIQVLGPRFIPATPAGYTHTVTADQRLDTIAMLYYTDPLRFWLIADANNEMDPEDLLVPGRGILIPPKIR